jgi:hypothetical protein
MEATLSDSKLIAMLKNLIVCCIFSISSLYTFAQVSLVSNPGQNTFHLNRSSILYDDNEPKLIKIAAQLLQQDIQSVTGNESTIYTEKNNSPLVIIGTTESKHIQLLLKNGKLTQQSLPAGWDGYSIQIVANPFPDVQQALVIIGFNKRGAAYGTLLLSELMGVSPWYWWADVPVKKQENIFVEVKDIFKDAPLVKYRGIFINDEAPALSNWSRQKFGGFNHLFYTKVFELILRNKGNFLWPAMWGSAFYDDDPKNQYVAEDWGIVIGTSHHEPLMRAHDEWRRYGKGAWNYQTNDSTLRTFWRSSLYRSKNEKIITLGMRGDGDEPMSNETATGLLERIVADQRKIIEEVSGQPAEKSPQVWALYKEVQDYYDKGMRVPDDVTLLICDDNWGNVRRLPKITDPARTGGYGMYYHFDYVGGPRNYKWLNTNPLPRVWEQMNLTWEHQVKELWVVNVGDIKPMELPISFFLHQAWNPTRISIDQVKDFTVQWATQQFGQQYGEEIAGLLAAYAKINGRRKPELLDHQTYSLTHYNEFGKVVHEYQQLAKKAEQLYAQLPEEYESSFFQLVLHPIIACANLNELYYQVALNHHYADKGDLRANIAAAKAKDLFTKDSLITVRYHTINNGKWNHMMSQTHIGYTIWQQPEKNIMPSVKVLQEGSFKNDTIATYQPVTENFNRAKNLYKEVEGVVSIDAAEYTAKKETQGFSWKVLPDLGRTADAITSFPVTSAPAQLTKKSPYLEYEIHTTGKGQVSLTAYFSPTLNIYHAETGLRYAVQIDHETPQIVGINAEDHDTDIWEEWMRRNIIQKTTKHYIKKAGKHTIRYWLVDNGVVLQKLVLNMGGEKPSFLGPPSTRK